MNGPGLFAYADEDENSVPLGYVVLAGEYGELERLSPAEARALATELESVADHAEGKS